MLVFNLKINFLKQFKKNVYILIPIICLALWALYYLFNINFQPTEPDFITFYSAGKTILINPSRLYKDNPGYIYLPNFATLLGVSLSLLPFSISWYIFYVSNILFGFLYIREFNKILILMNLHNRFHRFLFLIIISNGWTIFWIFIFNQAKMIVCLILLFVLRRKLLINKKCMTKKLQFYIVDLNLMILAMGIAPYLIFLFLIYIFYDISHFQDLFKKSYIQKFILTISLFIIQNFWFIIYTNLIGDFFFRGITHSYSAYGNNLDSTTPIRLFYLHEIVNIKIRFLIILTFIIIFILFLITIILILKTNLNIQEKYSIFALIFIFLDIYKGGFVLILIPLILLLYVPYMNQEENILNFVKKNKYLLLGLSSAFGINISFMSTETYFKYTPILGLFPLNIIIYLRWIIFLILIVFTLILLYYKKNQKNRIESSYNKFSNSIN